MCKALRYEKKRVVEKGKKKEKKDPIRSEEDFVPNIRSAVEPHVLLVWESRALN